ncbi:PilZ domain-containing protein [Photobacterium nomapromontoriensis]|uniref:PilZ domain-containing protein n=1 Tax=Photobacterium nomapromontoriensis TaxID=2910237 RepID=UPI003D09E8AE
MNQDEYFSVHAGLTINVEPLQPSEPVPNMMAFQQEIPPLFRIASECSGLDEGLERSLSQFNKDEHKGLMQYLTAQNSKINLLLSYVLSQQDDASLRFITHSFGASRLSYLAAQPLANGTRVRLKLFIDNPAAAVYAYAEVSSCIEQDEKFEITLKYIRLLDDDQDLLIRAALYFQQKILRQRAQQRSDDR